MKSILLLLIVILSFFSIIPNDIYALEPVILKQGTGKYAIGKHVEILEDKTNSYALEEVRGKELSDKFIPCTKDLLSLGFTNSSFWLKFSIVIPEGNKDGIYLECTYPFLDIVKLYIPQRDGKYIMKQGGDTFPFDQREVDYKNLAFKLPDVPGNYKYCIHVKNSGSYILPFYIITEQNFYTEMRTTNTRDGIIYGAILLLLIIILAVSIIVREMSYVFLSITISIVLLMTMQWDGTAFQFLWPNTLWLNNALPYSQLSWGLFFVIFLITFFNLKQKAPVLNRIIASIAFIAVVLLITSIIFLPYHYAMMFSSIFLYGITFFLLPVFLYLFYKEARQSSYVVTSLLFICGFAIYIFSANLGILPISIDASMTPKLVLLMLSGVFTVAVFNRIATIQKDKLRIQQEATATLEGKVEERTKELAEALDEVETINERLSESNAKLEGFGATLKRYLPMQLVDSIIRGEKTTGSPTERRKITVFFSDIKGFTETTDSWRRKNYPRS